MLRGWILGLLWRFRVDQRFGTSVRVHTAIGKFTRVTFSASPEIGDLCAICGLTLLRISLRNVVVQPFEEAAVDGFRGEFANEVGVGDVLVDDFLDRPTVAVLSFNEEDGFGLFHDPLFPTIGAGDGKPVGANRQSLLKKNAANLTCFCGRV
jgi:hypothetical protein